MNFEYGFAFHNTDGNAFYEIGTARNPDPILSSNLTCVQMYGPYFNRVVTSEPNPVDMRYVFGSCASSYTSENIDTSFNALPLSGTLSGAEVLTLSAQTEAGMVTPQTVMMFSNNDDRDAGMNPFLRVGFQVDETLPRTKQASRWIVGAIDYWVYYIKMVKVEIFIEDGFAKMRIVGQKRHTLTPDDAEGYRTMNARDWRVQQHVDGATNIFTDPSYYDLTKLFHNPSNTDVTDYKLQKLQYTSLRGTLPQPEPRSIAGISGEPNCSIETCSDAQRVVPGILAIADAPTLMAKEGEWGFDLDVRQVIVKSGTICSTIQNKGRCMYAVAQEFRPEGATYEIGEHISPSKLQKHCLFGALVGSGWKFVRIEVFTRGGALYAAALDAKVDFENAAADFDQDTGDGAATDMSSLFFAASSDVEPPIANWEAPKSNAAMNMAAVYYDLAGSVVPSLAGYQPIGRVMRGVMNMLCYE